MLQAAFSDRSQSLKENNFFVESKEYTDSLIRISGETQIYFSSETPTGKKTKHHME